MGYLRQIKYRYHKCKKAAPVVEILHIQYILTSPTCFYCDQPLTEHRTKESQYFGNLRTIDHIVPRSKNGANRIYNYVHACQDCNVAKADNDFVEFAISKHLEKMYIGICSSAE